MDPEGPDLEGLKRALVLGHPVLLGQGFPGPFGPECGLGTFAEDLRGFARLTHGIARWLATGAAYLVPNFSALNVISQVAHDNPVSRQLIAYNTVYALAYTVAVLSATAMIFERRNLK